MLCKTFAFRQGFFSWSTAKNEAIIINFELHMLLWYFLGKIHYHMRSNPRIVVELDAPLPSTVRQKQMKSKVFRINWGNFWDSGANDKVLCTHKNDFFLGPMNSM